MFLSFPRVADSCSCTIRPTQGKSTASQLILSPPSAADEVHPSGNAIVISTQDSQRLFTSLLHLSSATRRAGAHFPHTFPHITLLPLLPLCHSFVGDDADDAHHTQDVLRMNLVMALWNPLPMWQSLELDISTKEPFLPNDDHWRRVGDALCVSRESSMP